MYNLLECSSSYSDTTSSLWFYFKDEATNFNDNIADNIFYTYKAKTKTKLIGNTVANGDTGTLRNAITTVPLNYLSNFWQLLDILESRIEI